MKNPGINPDLTFDEYNVAGFLASVIAGFEIAAILFAQTSEEVCIMAESDEIKTFARAILVCEAGNLQVGNFSPHCGTSWIIP